MSVTTDEIIGKIHSKASDFRVTGLAIQYVTVCEREAWFYLNGIDINRQQANIKHGSSIDENSYQDAETIIIDGLISPDILEDGTILEVKRSSDSQEGAESQLLYYLWYFKKFKNEERDGEIAVPKERKRISVELTRQKEKDIVQKIERLWKLWNMSAPPELEKKPYCKACAYQDFCW